MDNTIKKPEEKKIINNLEEEKKVNSLPSNINIFEFNDEEESWGGLDLLSLLLGVIVFLLLYFVICKCTEGFMDPMFLRTDDPITLKYFGNRRDIFGFSPQDNYLINDGYFEAGDAPDYRDDRIFKNIYNRNLPATIAKNVDFSNCKKDCSCITCMNVAKQLNYSFWDDDLSTKLHGY